ncbi:hypothetical protein BB559_001318 [Furculomyces boomerangus]|uniref:Alpha-ketoglutarate-dependent dioxygenase AlkB-like domain-containing protein n=2 Tax=Harpellales TaxID=61421 RepID=A0A2T9Z2D5_9FUNG|nr:hypothetical protein BB559_001318 [Furculomyces boomerangus]
MHTNILSILSKGAGNRLTCNNIWFLSKNFRRYSNQPKNPNLLSIEDKKNFYLADSLLNPPDSKSYIKYSQKFIESEFNNSKNNILLYPDFITDSEHEAIVKGCEKKLRRYCRDGYAVNHFDSRITNYREFSCSSWLPIEKSIHFKNSHPEKLVNYDEVTLTIDKNEEKEINILNKVWSLFPNNWAWIPPHVLDLHEEGSIRAHVDNPEYSGLYVGGLCLLGKAISTFRNVNDPEIKVDLLLPPKSLYFFSHRIRYEFTHEITSLPEQRVWDEKQIPKQRRISIMFRDVYEK